jgi:ferrochelatase
MAYGGPNSLEEVPEFLNQVRGGRPVPAEVVHRYVARYRQIGGRSPLMSISQRVVEALRARISEPVYLGMRHWEPRIEAAIDQMQEDGVGEALAICLAPHFSQLSIGAYHEQLERALVSTGGEMQVKMVESWHLQPKLLDAYEAKLLNTLDRFPPDERDQVSLIFSAHSLPASILDLGDPYPIQVWETAEQLATRLALPRERWTVAYQSASRGGVEWLGPPVDAVLHNQAAAGQTGTIIAPIGFLADNLELLYDIDIELQVQASRLELHLERMPSLNASPVLVEALADLIYAHRSLFKTEGIL